MISGLARFFGEFRFINSYTGPQISIVVFAFLLALLFGMVATTAQPLFIALMVGVFVGIYAFSNAAITIWLVLGFGLFVAGLLPIIAAGISSKAAWGISVLGLLLLLSAISKASLTDGLTKGTPTFVWLVLVFMGYCALNGIIQSTFYELVSGFKRYFQVTSLCFALAWLGFSKKQMDVWLKLLLLLVVVQLPTALYELLKLVPIRESLRFAYPGMIPIDAVAGTFGTSRYGGGSSAEMATFLIMALAAVLARHQLSLLKARECVVLGLIALIPLFLGETKIVIVFLPLMFLTLYGRQILRNPLQLLAVGVFGSVLTIAVAYTYLQLVSASTFADMFYGIVEYNYHGKGQQGVALNRITALTFWLHQQGLHQPLSFFFGNGIGAAHNNTGGSLAILYSGYGIALTGLSTLLWEQGVVGVTLFYGVLILAWMSAGRIRRNTFVEANFRADAATIQCALSLFLVYPIYRSSMFEGLPFQIILWFSLGYLAWINQQVNKQTGCAASV
ncbi:MAG: hypothetical protein MI976_30555 [Pseudomonadales bacterium]|nr:hypothetical protein [Pseudomonadales bacterium]